jgi:hypothetical protein
MVPEGLRFHPARIETHQVWEIEGTVNLAQLVGGWPSWHRSL